MKEMGWLSDPKDQADHDDERIRDGLAEENTGAAQERKLAVMARAEVAEKRRGHEEATGKTYW